MNIFFTKLVFILISTVTFSVLALDNKLDPANDKLLDEMADPNAGSIDFEKGWTYLECKNYRQAFELFQSAGEQGHAGALNCLGLMYLNGLFPLRDNEKGMKYIKMAADKGFPAAQINLGFINIKQQDFGEAFKYFRLSAKQGYKESQNALALIYLYGCGVVEKNVKKAFKWYKRAADQGYKRAYIQLEKMYFDIQEEVHKLYLKKDTQSLKKLQEIRETEAYLNDSMENREYAGYWLKLIETKAKKLHENGNKSLKENPEYALDCYYGAVSQGNNNAKKRLQQLKKSGECLKFSKDFSKDDEIIVKENKIEWFLALRIYSNKSDDSKNNEIEMNSTFMQLANPKQNSQPISNDIKEKAPSNTNKKDKTIKNEQPRVNIKIQPEKKCEANNSKNKNKAIICNNSPTVAKEGLEININNQLEMSGESDNTKNIYKVSNNNTNDAAIAAEERKGLPKSYNQDVDMPAVDASTCHEKKTKKILHISNPLRGLKQLNKVVEYHSYKKETKKEKEERKRERNKSKVLGNLLDNSEKSCVSKSFADSLVSKSHFSITESEFDNEESFVSQSEGPMDDIKIHIKNIYPQLFRLIKKSKVEHLDQVKIPSSNLIRAILEILKEQKLIDGTISRDKIHVNKVGQQDEVFFAHTTHGSGNYAKWYHNPEVVVNFFTFVSNSDPKIKSYIISVFGTHCFSRDLEIDDSKYSCQWSKVKGSQDKDPNP